MTQNQTITDKFQKMIEVFRKDFDMLSQKEKSKEQMINSLKNPCQLYVFSSPNLAQYLVLKTHFNELKDKTVKIIQLKQDTFVKQFEEFLSDPVWLSSSSDMFGKPTTKKEKIEGIVVRFAQTFQLTPGFSTKGIGMMSLIDNNMSVWNIHGNIEDIDFNKEASKFVQGYKENTKQEENEKLKGLEQELTPQTKESIPDSDPGMGTFFYPPILVGELRPNLQEKIFGKKYELLQEVVINTDFDGKKLVITKGGLIGLETENEEVTEKILNTIMAISLISGLHCYAIRPTELANLSINKKSHKIIETSWSDSSKRMDLFDTRMGFQQNWRTDVRIQIEINDLNSIISKSKIVWNNTEQYHFLKLLLGAFTHLDSGEFSQSFIMSWNILERHLFELWRQKLLNARITKRIYDDLDRWDVYRVLEILHLDKEVSEDDYHEMKALQKLRNEVIHEGYVITEKQAISCYKLAKEKISKEVNISENIKIIDNVFI